MKKLTVGIVSLILVVAVSVGSYLAGRKTQQRVRYFSELTEKTRGVKVYLMDLEVVCANGKDLGRLQADLDLTNGRFVIVRNDSKLYPNCAK